MPTQLQWTDVALRLALAVAAGLLIGYNRSEHGRAAGMRTTLRVCLAATVAMIRVNLLLPLAGRSHDSFVMNDLMRPPLGILTGVDFIGGGVILRRGDVVVGVTTVATLWLLTVIGLCLGGGQIALGLATTVIGWSALCGLKWLEGRLRQEKPACLTIALEAAGPAEAEIRRLLREAGLSIVATRITLDCATNQRELAFEVREFRHAADSATPAFVGALAGAAGVLKLHWDRTV
jgi:putative Mg2+ transporter-C (MgtC) family protein